ncbi:hypothetical protein BU16DRAFT_532487 [Lophium mytilinum]|uniref:Uncharacterized protein n=1 Tax=Lophium mytilinum TaxID=390894 RepID=A0A6A6RBA3_9PEZI|nr:hypothetical protein BU16DRAFT_532487 [Lophium mytilinum]
MARTVFDDQTQESAEYVTSHALGPKFVDPTLSVVQGLHNESVSGKLHYPNVPDDWPSQASPTASYGTIWNHRTFDDKPEILPINEKVENNFSAMNRHRSFPSYFVGRIKVCDHPQLGHSSGVSTFLDCWEFTPGQRGSLRKIFNAV